MNVLRRLNNFLLPEDLAKGGGLLPEALAQLGAASGRSWVIFALEGVLAESPRCELPFAEGPDAGAFINLNLTFPPNKLGEAGSFSPASGARTHISWRSCAQEGPSLLHGAYLLPAPGLEAKPNITSWNETCK